MKKILLALFFLNLTACSYSPSTLKKIYNDLGENISSELKDPIDLSPQQATKIDNYASEVMRWHRRNKLPEYAQTFARLASHVEQDKPSLQGLQQAFKKLDGSPHFEQAKHLTPILTVVARSLNEKQISQLEQSFSDEYQEMKYEIKTQKQSTEIYNGIDQTFKVLGLSLSLEQKAIVKSESRKFHDLRWIELQYDKKWMDQIIALLRRSDKSQFSQQFAQLWQTKTVQFKGDALQKKQQNTLRQVKLFKSLLMKLDIENKNRLVSQLMSISYTFSEMANE